jgi:hypothetical protein
MGGFRRLQGLAQFPGLRDRGSDRLRVLAQVWICVVDFESMFQKGLSSLQLSLGQGFIRLLPQSPNLLADFLLLDAPLYITQTLTGWEMSRIHVQHLEKQVPCFLQLRSLQQQAHFPHLTANNFLSELR